MFNGMFSLIQEMETFQKNHESKPVANHKQVREFIKEFFKEDQDLLKIICAETKMLKIINDELHHNSVNVDNSDDTTEEITSKVLFDIPRERILQAFSEITSTYLAEEWKGWDPVFGPDTPIPLVTTPQPPNSNVETFFLNSQEFSQSS